MSQTIELDLTYEPYKNEVVRYTKYLGQKQIISPAEDVNEYKKRTTKTLFDKTINILNKLYNDINKNEPFLYKREIEDVFVGGYDPPGYNGAMSRSMKKQLITRYKINLNNTYTIKYNNLNINTCKDEIKSFTLSFNDYRQTVNIDTFKTIELLKKHIYDSINDIYLNDYKVGYITCYNINNFKIFNILNYHLYDWLANLIIINHPEIYKTGLSTLNATYKEKQTKNAKETQCKKNKSDQQQYIITYTKDIETFNIKKDELIKLHKKLTDSKPQIEKQIHELQDQYNKDGCATIRGGKIPLRKRHVQTRRYNKKRQQTVKRRRRQN